MRAAIALALTLFAAPTQARRRLEREAWNDDADAVVSCGACCLKVEPNDGTLDAWYGRVVDLAGFKVAASSDVRDAALLEAAYTVARMARDRPDLVATLVAEGVHLAVIGEDEVLTDIPGYASLGASWDWTRGVGATRWIPITSCAEENLLCLSDDVYSLENICLHETAHTLQGSGGKLPTTRLTSTSDGEDLDAVLRALYQEKVVEQDLFPNTYANDNHEEYWAEGVQAYYDLNTEGPEGGDGVHNHIDTRAELAVYDPELFNVIDGILADVDMSCPATVACDCADAEVVSICAAFDLLETTAAPTGATTCSADWGSCTTTGACCNAGFQCFEQNEFFSQCRESCDNEDWACFATTVAPTPAPTADPTSTTTTPATTTPATTTPATTTPATTIPSDCETYFDGCNTCYDFGSSCTEMFCVEYEEARCLTPAPTASTTTATDEDACAGFTSKKKCKGSCAWDKKAKTCATSSGDACSGLARKKCKNTAGCAYKKKTCSAADACSGLAKKKCKKKDSGCQWKEKACQTDCAKQKKRSKCNKTVGCEWKAKKEKCLASKK